MARGKGKGKMAIAILAVAGVAAYAYANSGKSGNNAGFGGFGGGGDSGFDNGSGLPPVSTEIPSVVERANFGNTAPPWAANLFDWRPPNDGYEPAIATPAGGGSPYPVLPAQGGGYVPVIGVGGLGAVSATPEVAAARFKIGNVAFDQTTGTPIGGLGSVAGKRSASVIAFQGVPRATPREALQVYTPIAANRQHPNPYKGGFSNRAKDDDSGAGYYESTYQGRNTNTDKVHARANNVINHNPAGYSNQQPDDDIGAGYEQARAVLSNQKSTFKGSNLPGGVPIAKTPARPRYLTGRL